MLFKRNIAKAELIKEKTRVAELENFVRKMEKIMVMDKKKIARYVDPYEETKYHNLGAEDPP